jgi:formamidopyrimidine-DNA glycosylase
MPELPEVEVVRRGLQQTIAGRELQSVEVRERRLRWPIPPHLESRLRRQKLDHVDRRGKYLLFAFDPGWLIVHLGMSGSLRFAAEPAAPRLHDHVDLVFEHGTLRYHDPRRFGAMVWHAGNHGAVTGHPLLANLGIEPFSDQFDGSWLYRATRGRKVAIKQALLSGTIVVGVGNIYASESLFDAAIRPTTPAHRISRARYERLAASIRTTLATAIERGGSSLRDFTGSDGEPGYFQLDAWVYGREGLPCKTCGSPIVMLRQQQRSTFYCRRCQS